MRATAVYIYNIGIGDGDEVWKWGNILQSVGSGSGQRKNILPTLGISPGNTYFCLP